ncbi:MAG: flavodoxin domain-containing protein, partial [Thermomicrobiaceae bacterium]|nr:flavodoxin domain-containing protein [Thermomicrobiaceae bacterium]
GSTREIGDAIAATLRERGHDVDARDAGEVETVEGYDAAIIGSAIYMGSWLHDARHLIEREQPRLRRIPVWLFASGPLGDVDPQPRGDPSHLADLLRRAGAREHRIFVGKLDPDALGVVERLIARAVHAPEGDFRDWDAIRDWARAIDAALAAEAARSAADSGQALAEGLPT